MALKVTIPEQDCTCVERLWYEYNAALGVLRYLMAQPDVLEKNLQLYADSCEAKSVELELTKREVSERFKPDGAVMSYSFNFDECAIEYQMEAV